MAKSGTVAVDIAGFARVLIAHHFQCGTEKYATIFFAAVSHLAVLTAAQRHIKQSKSTWQGHKKKEHDTNV